MNIEASRRIAELYLYYNETLKPILVSVEAKYENHPLPLFNEIRAFNDHISRCYREDITEEYRHVQIGKAKIHLDRLLFDAYKYLDVYYYDKLERFEKQCRNIDLTTINNGEFYIRYRQLRKTAVNLVREAKLLETSDRPSAFNRYQNANNTLEELDILIESNLTEVNWARVRFSAKRFIKLILWLIAAIIAGIISNLTGFLPYARYAQVLVQYYNLIFNH